MPNSIAPLHAIHVNNRRNHSCANPLFARSHLIILLRTTGSSMYELGILFEPLRSYLGWVIMHYWKPLRQFIACRHTDNSNLSHSYLRFLSFRNLVECFKISFQKSPHEISGRQIEDRYRPCPFSPLGRSGKQRTKNEHRCHIHTCSSLLV